MGKYTQSMHPRHQRKGGFAVVLAISFLTFITLMLVTLAALLQVEARSTVVYHEKELARQSAYYAMMRALGHLQRAAGPDSRITKPADNDLPGRENWTEVYDFELMDAAPALLVSGNPADAAADVQNPVELLSAGSGQDDQVVVPTENIESPYPQSEARIAYWISDEGVKASVGRVDFIDDAITSNRTNLPEDAIRRLRQGSGRNFGARFIEGFNGIIPEESPSLFEYLRGVDDLLVTNQVTEERVNQIRHDLTANAYGLLASPQFGLKRDLSGRHRELGDAFDAYLDYESYMLPPDTNPYYNSAEEGLEPRRIYTIPPVTFDNDIIHSVAPVVTDFWVHLNAHRADSDSRFQNLGINSGDLVLRISIMFEMWNPYTSALEVEDLYFKIRGLPTITLNTTADPPNNTAQVDVQSVLGNSDDEIELDINFGHMHSSYGTRDFNGLDDNIWLAGRVYNWMSANNYSRSDSDAARQRAEFRDSKNYTRNFSEYIYYVRVGEYPGNSSSRHGFVVPEAQPSVAIFRKASAPVFPEEFQIAEYSFEPYFDVSQAPGSHTDSSKSTKLGYRMRIKEPGDEPLLTPYQRFSLTGTVDPRFVSHQSGTDGLYFAPDEDPTAFNNLNTSISQNQWFFDRVAGGSGKSMMEDVPMFELPRRPHISIGELQHLQIINRAPYAIGNPWGSLGSRDWNLLFDEYFFSGVTPEFSADTLTVENPLPNFFLHRNVDQDVTVDLLRSTPTEVATRFLVEGAFNINSTSADAWTAVLTSLSLQDWPYVNIDDRQGDATPNVRISKTTVGSTFTRYPQSLHEVFEVAENARDHYEPPTEFFRQGAGIVGNLEVDENVVNGRYRALAESISQNIRRRHEVKGPFKSVAEFLAPDEGLWGTHSVATDRGRSLIEQVLDENPDFRVPNTVFHNDDELIYMAPMAISQADIMTALGPIVNVRSDTFRIRAYGEFAAPGSVDKSVAYCEALVRRRVDPVDADSDPTARLMTGLGRRFEILEFRWLTKDEI